jgi:ABC-type transport system involved in multi-copper enzyme maturation permease subunit
MIGRIWAIALNTFREAVRIRVLYGILVLVVGVNLMSLLLRELAATADEARIARDVGLAGISLFGSLTAIFLGVFLLYTEVQRRTVHAIVVKPIERWEFVVGKYAGMALVLSVLVGVFAAAMAGTLAWQGVPVSAAIGKAIALAWVEVLVVAAIAIFFSSFSTPFLSGIFALGVWAIGRVTPDLERATESASPAIRWTAELAARVVPDLHLFAVSGRVVGGEHVSVHADFVPWSYVGLATLSGLGWIAGLLALAAVLFHRRDFA